MKHTKHLLVLWAALLLGAGNAWGAEVTETATFNSKSWGIADGSNFSWTSGKDGNGFTNNQGVQITTGVSGANATTSKSFTNISKIEVTYCTKSKAGKGTITLQVGTGTEQSFSVSAPSKGGTTRKTTTFNYATPESGAVKLTVVCTTNSIYIYSITVTYESGSTGTTLYLGQEMGDPPTP